MRRLVLVLGLAGTVPAACGAGAPHGAEHGHVHAGPAGHRFEKAEDWVGAFDDPGRDAWQMPQAVVALLAIAPGMTVADLGAGTGYFEPHLSRAVGPSGKVLALDVEQDMVRYLGERAAREHLGNVVALQVAFDDPGLPAGAVDRVLIVDTWHHIADRAAYVRRLATGLAAGGTVTVVDFTKESPMGPPPAHRLTAAEVVAELEAGGLAAQVVDEPLPHQYAVVGRRR
jgi:SAM-dependent methyltransferase